MLTLPDDKPHVCPSRGVWGPHLIVVPTSVMLNWEVEFKKWCPAFKLLTYYGSAKERKKKREGWSKPNAFHVCITSYTLVLQAGFDLRPLLSASDSLTSHRVLHDTSSVMCCLLQDAKMFRRKKWKYLILDEAHMIKNWKSQRWQTLLNFNSKRRLLITGAVLTFASARAALVPSDSSLLSYGVTNSIYAPQGRRCKMT